MDNMRRFDLKGAGLPFDRATLEAMPGGVFIYRADGAGEILFANRAMLALCACEGEDDFLELTGGVFNGLVSREDREVLPGACAAVDEGSAIPCREYRILTRTGETRRIRDHARRLSAGGTGDLYCVFATDCRDLPEKAAEASHMYSILRVVAEDYLCLIDVDLETEREVQFFRDESGTSLPQWGEPGDYATNITEYAMKIVAVYDRGRFLEQTRLETLKKLLSERKEFVIEYDATPGMEIRRFQGRFTISAAGDGRPHMFVGIRDITEAESLRFDEERRLREALSQAESANKAKTTFLFNLSHDIRTPMNAVLGFKELALRHLDQPQLLKEYLNKIGLSGEHLLGLINEVLEMARIESGTMQLAEEPGDLKRLCGEWAVIFRHAAEDKGVRFAMECEISNSAVSLDKTKVEEILLNIVGNAVKYTPAGGSVSVSMSQKPSSIPGCATYETVVEDTGIGMSREYLPKLFDSFSRERSASESGIQGTGLGMGIVRSLIDFLKGAISVDSEQGKGTRITVSLPLKVLAADSFTQAGNEADEIDYGRLKGKRILLAEDNDLNAEIAMEFLTEAGLFVDRATDGLVCVDQMNAHEGGYYDLILMDIQMPAMDGYTAASLIRGMPDERRRTIPIFAMTANAFEEDRVNAVAAGMDGHIAKPIEPKALFALLARAL